MFAQYFTVRSAIGCALSHILLADKLYNENIPVALVVEDDAYPRFPRINFDKIMNEVPDDWEMIKLHCDVYCKDGSNNVNRGDGSTAAYIINRKGMLKIKNMKVITHIDFVFSSSNIKHYKSNINMFVTDESSSVNRKELPEYNWLTPFIPKPITGEKSIEHIIGYSLIVVPGTSVTLTLGDYLILIYFIVLTFVCYYLQS